MIQFKFRLYDNNLLSWYGEALIFSSSFSNQEVFEKEQSICAVEEQPTEDGVSEERMFLLTTGNFQILSC